MILFSHFLVQAPPPHDVEAVQNGPTSVLVSWSPSSGTIGYMIHYDSSGGHNGSISLNSSTDNFELAGLMEENTYTISIFASSVDLPSTTIELQIRLSKSLAIHVYLSLLWF